MDRNVAGAAITGSQANAGKVLFTELSESLAGEGGALVWSPAGRGDVLTFAEAYEAVLASKAPMRIFVNQAAGDPPLTVPAGVYEMRGSEFSAYEYGDPSLNLIICAPKTKFRNLFFDGPLVLQGNNVRMFISDDGPLLENDSSNPGISPVIYVLKNGAVLQNNGVGGLVDVDASGFVFLGSFNGGGFLNGTFAGSFVKLHAGQLFGLASIGSPPSFDTHTVSSDVGVGVVGLLHDGNITPPIDAALFPLFTGSLKNLPFGQDGCSGATLYRPDGMLGTIPSGCMYFDTTLGIPVWWSGPDAPFPNRWQDATGAAA